MSKHHKHSDPPDDFPSSTTETAPSVPVKPTPPVAPPAPAQPRPGTPAPAAPKPKPAPRPQKRYRVSLNCPTPLAHASYVLEAADEGEAKLKFEAVNGICGSVHPYAVNETDEPLTDAAPVFASRPARFEGVV